MSFEAVLVDKILFYDIILQGFPTIFWIEFSCTYCDLTIDFKVYDLENNLLICNTTNFVHTLQTIEYTI